MLFEFEKKISIDTAFFNLYTDQDDYWWFSIPGYALKRGQARTESELMEIINKWRKGEYSDD